MPPSPSTPAKPMKRLGWAIVLLSLLLLFSLFALIWNSTAGMPWLSSPAMQAIRSESSGAGFAPGMPAADFGYDDYSGSGVAIAPSPMPPVMLGNGAPPEDRERVGERVIRNGSLSIRVDDVEIRLNEARAIASAENGFVADANVVNREGVKSATITIRVPQDAFDRTLARLKGLASTVFNESTNTEDVTAQFVDLEARLGAARAEEAQYLRILEQADTIEETLQVTARLGEVRSRIESMEGQLRYLRDRTEYSTISVSMTSEARVQAPTQVWRPGETFRESLQELVIALQGLADLLIAFGVFLIGLVLPVALLIALAAWIVYAIWKRLRSKR
ncbi:MAG: DUF4349 domain-containing protein [Candidatus Uhrbacteria bacterium]|nr:DUF4349 domain-containing protein [Candidatus Uhrbacteria bacterium]